MTTPPTGFRELYVISDLHLGGEEGREAVSADAARRLEWLVDEVCRRADALRNEVDGRVGLLLNGDIFDFLASPEPTYFDATAAMFALRAITRGTGESGFSRRFSPVLQKLGKAIGVHGVSVIMMIGNHDIELAVPAVQACLREELGVGDHEALEFCMSGQPWVTELGGQTVWCVHGNVTDEWNRVNEEWLASSPKSVTTVPPTNPGTQLVIDAMNEVKRKYPYIDLLKPERFGVVVNILALDPSLVGKLDTLSATVSAKVRRLFGLLGITPDLQAQPLLALAALDEPPPRELDDWAQRISDDHRFGVSPTEGFSPGKEDLGAGVAIVRRLFGAGSESVSEDVRHGLRDALKNDQTFGLRALSREDRAVRDHYLRASTGPKPDVLLVGHTHHPRHVSDADGKVFVNTGTWMRVLDVRPFVESRQAFAEVWRRFASGALSELDAPIGNRTLVRDDTAAIARLVSGPAPKVELFRVGGATFETFSLERLTG